MGSMVPQLKIPSHPFFETVGGEECIARGIENVYFNILSILMEASVSAPLAFLRA